MFRSAILISITIGAVGGCHARNGGSGAAEKEGSRAAAKAGWPLKDLQATPAEITVLSGTTFRWGQVTCQLLGVRESADPAVRQQADEFSRLWFKSVGNFIGVYNSTNPLMAPDGTAVVWIRGYDTYLSCLSEELVRTGLAEVDDSKWGDYAFTVPTKDGEGWEDWRGILRKAHQGRERGEKPRVLFDWPPK